MTLDLERKLSFAMRTGASLVQIVEAYQSARAEEARQQAFASDNGCRSRPEVIRTLLALLGFTAAASRSLLC
jgi:hypothetical protein